MEETAAPTLRENLVAHFAEHKVKYSVFAGVLGTGILVDQATKLWVVANIAFGSALRGDPSVVTEIPIIPSFLSIVHAQNHGAAFSSFEGMWGLFMVFTVVATVVVLDLLRRLRPDALFMSGILGLILSGALGNGIDRVRQGYVTDFIRVFTDLEGPKAWLIDQFGTNTWPIFNVADSVLLIGVTLFLVHYLFLEEGEPEEADEPLIEGDSAS